MEKLWEDLSSSPDYSPPAWHGDELARRKNAVEEKKETYTGWNKSQRGDSKRGFMTVNGHNTDKTQKRLGG